MDIYTLVCPICPHCGAEKVAFNLLNQIEYAPEEFAHTQYYQLWQCGNCHSPACSYSLSSMHPGGNSLASLEGFYPVPKEITAPYGVPENIGDSFRSGKRYMKLGRDADYEAACIMARRCVEQAVNDFGAEGKDLFQKIENLEVKRLIPPAMRDWAHHVRKIGNGGAHGEMSTEDDARQSVYFAEMLLTYLYSLPKMMEAYRNNS